MGRWGVVGAVLALEAIFEKKVVGLWVGCGGDQRGSWRGIYLGAQTRSLQMPFGMQVCASLVGALLLHSMAEIRFITLH
jgi:hypothetical protein